MRCAYCAEEIQDAAIVCRFCGAVKGASGWRSPQMAAATSGKRPGRWTMMSSGVLLLFSALLELGSVTSAVPLLGTLQGGAFAAVYHLAFAALFAVMGAPLVWPRPWGLRAFLGGTALYTIDRVVYALDRAGREADLMKSVQGHDEVFQAMPKDLFLMLGPMVALLSMASLWGLAIYAYVKRDYFTM